MKKLLVLIILLTAVNYCRAEKDWGKSLFQAEKKKVKKAVSKPSKRFTITGIFYSPGFKIAVIDGYIVKEGSFFAGNKVLTIAPAHVRIRQKSGRIRKLILKDILSASKEEGN